MKSKPPREVYVPGRSFMTPSDVLDMFRGRPRLPRSRPFSPKEREADRIEELSELTWYGIARGRYV